MMPGVPITLFLAVATPTEAMAAEMGAETEKVEAAFSQTWHQ